MNLRYLSRISSKNLLLSLLIIACFFAAVFAIFPNNSSVEISNESSVDWSENWNFEGNIINLPHYVQCDANDSVTIDKEINNVFENSGMSLSFISSLQKIIVKVDGETIYSFNQESNRYMETQPPPAWHLIRLKPEMIGKHLSITYSSPIDGYGGVLNEISVGSKFANVSTFIRERFFSLLLCFTIFVFGVIGIIVHGFLLNRMPELTGLLYLGIFACLIALWSACETRALQIFFGNVQLIMVMTFLSLMLAPIALILFFRDRFSGIWLKISNAYILAFTVYFLAVLLLQGFGIITFNSLFLFFVALLGTCLVTITAGLVYCFVKTPVKDNFLPVVAMGFVVVFGLIDIVRYTLGKLFLTSNADSTMFTRIGILLFILTLGYQMARHMLGYYADSITAATYKQRANTDSLTGLFNRAYLEEIYGKIFFNSIRNRHYFSVILIDIDNFKNYNDNMGHIKGDEVIRSVSKILKESVHRPLDCAVRYGGEEFLVILPGIDTDGAAHVAGLISEAINNLCIPHEFSSVCGHITVSQGIYSGVPANGQGIEDFINRADKAMYRAKSKGKNRCAVFNEKDLLHEQESADI